MNDLQVHTLHDPTFPQHLMDGLNNTDRTPIEVLLQVGEDERVSARSVYEFLQLHPDNFSKWSKANITESEFCESGADFSAVFLEEDAVTPSGATYIRKSVDYRLSISLAKEICMLSRTKRGDQARKYFIKVEKALQTVAQRLPQLTQAEMMLQMAQNTVELERQLGEVKAEVKQIGGKLENALQVFAKPGENWKDSVELAMRKLVEGQDGWALKRLQGKLYAELEVAANCDLNRQVSAKKKRLKENGAKYKRWNFVTKLEVISDDSKLRPIFESILRKYQATYAQDN